MPSTPEIFPLGGGAAQIVFKPYASEKSSSLGSIEITSSTLAPDDIRQIRDIIHARISKTGKQFSMSLHDSGMSLGTAVMVAIDPEKGLDKSIFLTKDDIRNVLQTMAQELPEIGVLQLAIAAEEGGAKVSANRAINRLARREVDPYFKAVVNYLNDQNIVITHDQWHGIQDALVDAYKAKQARSGGD